jgi:hypothetical protein
MAVTKRAFDNVRALGNRHPQVLRDLLERFPEHVQQWELDLTAEELDLVAIRDAFMAAEIPEELDDILYLSTALGNSNGWAMIERQAEEDGLLLPHHNADLTDTDMAVLAAIHNWPANLRLLERANARARIHAKSVFKYFPMEVELRHQYRAPTPETLAEAVQTLQDHYVSKGFIHSSQRSSVRIMPYDFEHEIWFLIGYAAKKQRHRGCKDSGEMRAFDFNPEQFDAVVYNKVFGDIRMNTRNWRKKDHHAYRLSIGRMLLDDGSAFSPSKKMVTLTPLELPNAADLFATDDIAGLAEIEPIELKYGPFDEPRTYTLSADKGSSLRAANPLAPRLVPCETRVCRAVFEYRLKDSRRRGRLTLSPGNKIGYERDGDSLVLEEWLRARGFLLSLVGDVANALQKAA